MSELERLFNFFGTQEEIARTLNVTQGAVSQWLSTGGLPAKRALQIERITKGQFKALDIVAPSEKEDI